MRDISRRSFLKQATVATTVGAASAVALPSSALADETSDSKDSDASAQKADSALAGQQAQGSSSGEPAEKPGDATYGAILNPKAKIAGGDDFSALFQPMKIGGYTMRNRFAKSSAGSEKQKTKGWPDDEFLKFYGNMAENHVGLVAIESSNIFPDSPIPSPLDISSDDGIAAHAAIADYLHQYEGTLVIAQMLDMTMATGGGGNTTYNEKYEYSYNPGIVQSVEDIHKEQQNFIDAGVRYWKAGFDGVEINCSCNHYFSTFLSRWDNHTRTDEYSGDSIENRCRIVTEIIEGIREQTGDDFIIQVLYSAVEENVSSLGDNRYCTTIEEGCAMAEEFERAGASSLHIRSEAYGHHAGGYMPDMWHIYEDGDTGYGSVIDFDRHFCGLQNGSMEGLGGLIDVAAEVKKHVSIPVGVVGDMDPLRDPEFFNSAVADGKVDFYIMTRPLLADYEYVRKLEEGRADEIAPCARCLTCFPAPFDFTIPMYCRVNPALTRAYGQDMPEGYIPSQAENPKNVMVIGGGPAGMEAARIAAQRGHHVSLYESAESLGGKLDFVQAIKGRHERIVDHKNYLIRQLELNGVEVTLNQEVDADFVAQQAPDVAVVAVGSVVTQLSSVGVSDEDAQAADVLDFDDLQEYFADGDTAALTDRLGDAVVVIGAQFQGCVVATNLARYGKKVYLLNTGSEDEYFNNATIWVAKLGEAWLDTKGVKVFHEVQLTNLAKGSVTFTTPYGVEQTLEVDNIVNAIPRTENRTLFDELKSSGNLSEVYAVGDCYAPGTIANATARGNIVARKLGDGQFDASDTQLSSNQYSATATGIGEVTVTITVENGEITAVDVDTSNETEGIGRELGDTFEQQIMENGAPDTISGATLTSGAVLTAFKECKAQAGLS